MNTPTPRTDAVVGQREFGSLADSEYVRLARQLERELGEAKSEADSKIQHLLHHCKDAECSTCAEIVCKHHEALHFHHDGCPACECAPSAEQIGKSWLENSSLEKWFPITAEELERLRKESCSLKQDRDEWKAIAEELAKACVHIGRVSSGEGIVIQHADETLARFNAKKAQSA